MILNNIKLQNFRNYKNLELEFSPSINIIYGDNAQGKTNLLESIYVLGLTKSHKNFLDKSLINQDCEFSKIIGEIKNNTTTNILEVKINNLNKEIKKDNKIINKLSDYISTMNLIIFYPEDLELIKGSPNIRRRYLNIEISQVFKSYINIFNDYNKLLKIRNDYLKKIKNKQIIDFNYFNIITDKIIEKGIEIYLIRNKYIENINEFYSSIYNNITNIKDFYLKYISNVVPSKEKMLQIFKEIYIKECRIGTTLIGPHRDDFEFLNNNKYNLKTFGSQGQQRIAILSMKLSEIEVFKKYTNEPPILLLDDVFSELDNNKKNNLLKYIDGNIQTIITTTELEKIDEKILSKSNLIKIKNGNIQKNEEVE